MTDPRERGEGADLVTSEYAITEARRNLMEPEQEARLEELLKGVERRASTTLSPEQRSGIELSEKDWPIVAGALEAGATHLITGDRRDFGAYLGGGGSSASSSKHRPPTS